MRSSTRGALPLSAQQLDERLATLQWLFQQERSAGQHLHPQPAGRPRHGRLARQRRAPAAHGLARLHAPGSTTSVWWISATPRHAPDEVVQHEVLHRRLFTRLFKGA
jgi:type VI secretion system protein ImpM